MSASISPIAGSVEPDCESVNDEPRQDARRIPRRAAIAAVYALSWTVGTLMRELRLEVKSSTDGEDYRTIAIGMRHSNGTTDFPSVSEQLPHEMLSALECYFQEFGFSTGTFKHKVGNIDYQVAFTPASTKI